MALIATYVLQADSFVGVYRLESPDDQHRMDGRQVGVCREQGTRQPSTGHPLCKPAALPRLGPPDSPPQHGMTRSHKLIATCAS